MSGEFFASTGLDLREQPPHLVFELAYSKLRRSVIYDEDQAKQFNKLDNMIRALEDNVSEMPDWVSRFAVQKAGAPADVPAELMRG